MDGEPLEVTRGVFSALIPRAVSWGHTSSIDLILDCHSLDPGDCKYYRMILQESTPRKFKYNM